jgi:hypothetical protein
MKRAEVVAKVVVNMAEEVVMDRLQHQPLMTMVISYQSMMIIHPIQRPFLHLQILNPPESFRKFHYKLLNLIKFNQINKEKKLKKKCSPMNRRQCQQNRRNHLRKTKQTK